MLEQHFEIFKEVAVKNICHILLRSPNRNSDRFVVLPRAEYTAKPLHCKAKTADNPEHKFAGLVVSPEVVPEAFTNIEKAKAVWQKFAYPGPSTRLHRPPTALSAVQRLTLSGGPSSLPAGYALAVGPWVGCVTLHGKLIHADYDLLAASPAKNADSKTNPVLIPENTSEKGILTPYMAEIMKQLNGRFKCEMIQHGAEFDAEVYNYGMCHHFYPDGSHKQVQYTGNQVDGNRIYNS